MRSEPVLALFVATALFLCLPACRAADQPAFVNPELAAAYSPLHGLARSPAGAEEATRKLQALEPKDPKNALRCYLLALAQAKTGDWGSAAASLDAGNKMPHYTCYQKYDAGFANLRPDMATLRELARQYTQRAAEVGPDKGRVLLWGIRAAAARSLAAEPPDASGLLVVGAVRTIADKALVDLYTNAGQAEAAERARKMQAADKQWIDGVKAAYEPIPGARDRVSTALELSAIPNDELNAADAAGLSAETRRKLELLAKQVEELDRPMIRKWSKLLPQ